MKESTSLVLFSKGALNESSDKDIHNLTKAFLFRVNLLWTFYSSKNPDFFFFYFKH